MIGTRNYVTLPLMVAMYQRNYYLLTNRFPEHMSDDGVTEWLAHIKRTRAAIIAMGAVPVETAASCSFPAIAKAMYQRNARQREQDAKIAAALKQVVKDAQNG